MVPLRLYSSTVPDSMHRLAPSLLLHQLLTQRHQAKAGVCWLQTYGFATLDSPSAVKDALQGRPPLQLGGHELQVKPAHGTQSAVGTPCHSVCASCARLSSV